MVEDYVKKENRGVIVVLGSLFVATLLTTFMLTLFRIISWQVFVKFIVPILCLLIIFIVLKGRTKQYLKGKKDAGVVSHFPEQVLNNMLKMFYQCVLRIPLVYDGHSEDCRKKSFWAGQGSNKTKILWVKMRERYNPIAYHHLFIRYDKLEDIGHFKHNPNWNGDKEKKEVKEYANDMCDNPADMINIVKRKLDPDTGDITHEEVITKPQTESVVQEEVKQPKDFLAKNKGGGD